MAQVVVDTGFLVALLSRSDQHHGWAVAQIAQHPHPWLTCEAVLSEAFHLLGPVSGAEKLAALISRGVLHVAFHFSEESGRVLDLMKKYADVPMSLADGCLVRLSEIQPDPMLLATDSNFRVYRRLGRKVIPAKLPA